MKKFPEVESAWLYGSRAKGSQKHGSDVDIAVKGKEELKDHITRVGKLIYQASRM